MTARRHTQWRYSASPSRAACTCCGSRPPIPRFRCPNLPHPPDPRPGPAVPGGSGHLPEPRPANSPTSSYPLRRGVKRPERSRTPTAPCTCRRRPSNRPASARSDLTSFSTTHGEWTSVTRTVIRCRRGTTPNRHSRRGRSAAPDARATTAGSATRSCGTLRGIQWPCNSEHPDGTERLYADGRLLGASRLLRDLREGPDHRRIRWTPAKYRAINPDGKAMLKAAEFLPPHESPSAAVSLRVDHRPHAVPLPHPHEDWPRTPTAKRRARCLGGGVRADADDLRIDRGRHRRGAPRREVRVEAKARISGIRKGVLFMPFHYGYWDVDADGPIPSRRGQRAVPHRLGPGLQAADVQDCGGAAGPRRIRRRGYPHRPRPRLPLRQSLPACRQQPEARRPWSSSCWLRETP